jgi:hypothetical protein
MPARSVSFCIRARSALFAATPPVINPGDPAVTQIWKYVGELCFNMLVLVGTVKMADRIVKEVFFGA